MRLTEHADIEALVVLFVDDQFGTRALFVERERVGQARVPGKDRLDPIEKDLGPRLVGIHARRAGGQNSRATARRWRYP